MRKKRLATIGVCYVILAFCLFTRWILIYRNRVAHIIWHPLVEVIGGDRGRSWDIQSHDDFRCKSDTIFLCFSKVFG